MAAEGGTCLPGVPFWGGDAILLHPVLAPPWTRLGGPTHHTRRGAALLQAAAPLPPQMPASL
jgi:hypothetical protein